MNELYKNIKKRRQELSMTQQELAEKIGYTDRSSVAKIGMKIRKLETRVKIMQIAKALETTPGDLMGNVEHEESQYYDSETVQIVTDRLRRNPEYSVLFKAASNVKPEEIEYVTRFIEKFSD